MAWPVRTIAFLLLFTTTAWAQTGTPAITVGPNAPVTPEWLGREMASVPACQATTPLDPAPHTMIADVNISKGAVTSVTATTSSGNPAFDQKAIQCLQNLSASFTTKIVGDLAMVVPVMSKDGAVVPQPDPSAAIVPTQRPATNAITVQHSPSPALANTITVQHALPPGNGFYAPRPGVPRDWLPQAMAKVPACTAALGTNLKPTPRPMEIGIHFIEGAVVVNDNAVTASSGNAEFDRDVATCFARLPPDMTAKLLGNISLYVQVYDKNGTIALVPSPPPPPPPPPPFLSKPGYTAPSSVGQARACQREDVSLANVGLGEVDNVTLSFTVTETGAVKTPSVLTSSGYNLVDDAALQCVSRWIYKPATQNGMPIAAVWRARIKMVWDPTQYDQPSVALYHAGMACVRSLPNDQVVQNPGARTVIAIHELNGAVDDVMIFSVSGNPVQDNRARDCFAKVAPDFVKDMDGSKWRQFFVPWN